MLRADDRRTAHSSSKASTKRTRVSGYRLTTGEQLSRRVKHPQREHVYQKRREEYK